MSYSQPAFSRTTATYSHCVHDPSSMVVGMTARVRMQASCQLCVNLRSRTICWSFDGVDPLRRDWLPDKDSRNIPIQAVMCWLITMLILPNQPFVTPIQRWMQEVDHSTSSIRTDTGAYVRMGREDGPQLYPTLWTDNSFPLSRQLYILAGVVSAVIWHSLSKGVSICMVYRLQGLVAVLSIGSQRGRLLCVLCVWNFAPVRRSEDSLFGANPVNRK